MRVMCVTVPSHWINQARMKNEKHPLVGDIVEVVDEWPCGCGWHEHMYSLKGYVPGTGYSANCFSPLPDADEIESAEFEAIIPNPNY
jgi:hypothetical protein